MTTYGLYHHGYTRYTHWNSRSSQVGFPPVGEASLRARLGPHGREAQAFEVGGPNNGGFGGFEVGSSQIEMIEIAQYDII